MKTKKIMLFTYDGPHKKTQDLAFRLMVEGYHLKYMIAAPWVKLPIPPSSLKFEPSHVGIIHPKDICRHFGIDYQVIPHNSVACQRYLQDHPVDLYIIAGARILKSPVIISAHHRILNLHPGMLPQVRGLDTLLWSIETNNHIGVTGHFIEPKIDSGLMIHQEIVPVYQEDNLTKIALRLLEIQPDILINSIKILETKSIKQLATFPQDVPYHTKMTPAQEQTAHNKFPLWLARYSNK